MKKRFSKQFIRYFILIFMMLFLLVGIWYQTSTNKIVTHINDDVDDYFQLLENRMILTYEDRVRDLIYTRGLTESLLADGRSFQHISKFYYELSKSLGLYDQIRYLDVQGQEQVRINFEAGNPRIVAGDELQDKSQRYYFVEMTDLKREGIYFSPLDLNIENGEVEWPLKPMIRMGMRVEDAQGNPIGFIVLNYLAANWMQTESQYFSSTDKHMIDFQALQIINQDGYYLKHEDPEEAWGFVLSERGESNFASQFPSVWAKRNQTEVVREEVDKGLVYMKKITGLQPQPPYEAEPYEVGYFAYSFPEEKYRLFFLELQREWISLIGLSVFFALLGAYFLENSAKVRKERLESLHKRVNRDELTGLFNKSGFLSMIPSERKRWNDGVLAVGYFDIDDFKSVNDQFGHATGDEVLIEVGKRLQEVLRERDLSARIHGDEFNILLKLRKGIDATVVARRLINRMKDPIETSVGKIHVTVSLGIAFVGQEESFEQVSERADRLMYEVKKSGKSDYRIEGLASETES